MWRIEIWLQNSQSPLQGLMNGVKMIPIQITIPADLAAHIPCQILSNFPTIHKILSKKIAPKYQLPDTVQCWLLCVRYHHILTATAGQKSDTAMRSSLQQILGLSTVDAESLYDWKGPGENVSSNLQRNIFKKNWGGDFDFSGICFQHSVPSSLSSHLTPGRKVEPTGFRVILNFLISIHLVLTPIWCSETNPAILGGLRAWVRTEFEFSGKYFCMLVQFTPYWLCPTLPYS